MIIKVLTSLFVLNVAGFMAFDGLRGLLLGDYLRPKKGKFAGQLGPWAGLVRKAGIQPESRAMKWIFVLYGLLGLTLLVFYWMEVEWADTALLLFAVGSLWYLMVGTVFSLGIILLLLLG